MNFLYIGLDQARFDAFGFNGNEICSTPNLDRLAEKSFRFKKAYATAPLCSPTRASVFTGKYAFSHGMGTNCDMYHSLAAELPDPEGLLHKKLLEKGYSCGYIGKWHVGTQIGPCDYGFEGQNIPGYGNMRNEPEYLEYLEKNGLDYKLRDNIYYNPGEKTMYAAVWDGPEESTIQYYLAERTMGLLDKYAESDEPFFLTCQFWGPHAPHFPPASFAGKTDRTLIEPWINHEDDLAGKPNYIKRERDNFLRKPPKDWDEWREVIGLYYDFTSFIDKQIGRILDRLESLGLSENTMIIFASDHGDMKGAHGGMIDKGYLYEEAMHIPMMVHHPGKQGGLIEDFVYNMDIMPTVLDAAGIGYGDLHGKSLLPLFDNGEWDRDCAYLEFHGIRFLYTQRSVIDRNNYKYIWTPGDFDELYDLNTDPGELNNVIEDPEYAVIKCSMQEKLKKCGVEFNDPVQDYIYKILGEWESPSGQIDITRQK